MLTPEEFCALLDRCEARIVRTCQKYFTNPTDAEDMAQDARLKAWRSRHTYRRQEAECAWIVTLATNNCFDKLRRVRLQQDYQKTLESDSLINNFAPSPASATESSILLHECLSQLSADEVQVVVLRGHDGRTFEELKEIMGRDVRALYERAIKKLRICLENKGINMTA